MKKMMKWTTASAVTAGMIFTPAAMFASTGDQSSSSPHSASQHMEGHDMLLMEGAQGETVQALQQELDDRGITTQADGIFGPQTASSVQNFQKNLSLTVDGIAGMETFQALHMGLDDPGMLIQTGAVNKYVYAVQHGLNKNELPVTNDGIFGPETKQRVMEYQEQHDLAVDGIVGPQTWEAMFSMSDQQKKHMKHHNMPMEGSMDEDMAMDHEMGMHDDMNMNHSSSGEVPETLAEAESPTYEVGSKAIIEANHMAGMEGAAATISGAFDTTAYAVSFTPTTGGDPVKDHKWVIHEELENPGSDPLEEGETAVMNADHMEGMDGAEATVDTAETTTVYMVDFTMTTNGEEVVNHKWVTESELSPEA